MTGKPLPKAIKIFKGTARKSDLSEFEPTPSRDKIMPPSDLTSAALQHWDAVVEQLVSSGIMTNLDNQALGMYCEAYSKWVYANNKIASQGMVIETQSGGPIQSPYISISNKAFEQMRSMLTEFGMTPSSRTRIKVEPKKIVNEFDQF